MSDEGPFQHVHAVAAGVGMSRVDDAGWIANQADFHAGFLVGVEVLAEEGLADPLVEALEGIRDHACVLFGLAPDVETARTKAKARPKKKAKAKARSKGKKKAKARRRR